MTPLLFIKHKSFNARTVDNDLIILSEKYNVKLYNSKIGRGIFYFTGFVIDFLYLLFNLYRFKVVFIWFADYHSFFPCLFSKILNKKCFVCLGGYDTHWIVPDKAITIKEKIRKYCVIKSIQLASVVFPVSNWLSTFITHLKEKDKIQVAYCCVNPDAMEASKEIDKENLILTVGGGGILYEAKRKKLDFFIEVGNYFNQNFPDYKAKFILIGHEPGSETYNYFNKLIKDDNIRILPHINDTRELRIFFRKSKVYCQFSEYEAFGIAIIEAMLNEAIPIVYDGGAMPEVINNTGIIITHYHIEETALIIKKILDNGFESLKSGVKKRVLQNFTVNKRKEILFKYL
ncbi:MAG TPA: glycosyltransferase [Ignavibacteria bacterium]